MTAAADPTASPTPSPRVVVELVQESNPWDALWPLLLTALLTLAIALVVQYRVVPRVDARKRREDRWERDLIRLGELLTFEHAAVVSTFTSKFSWHVIFQVPVGTPETADQVEARLAREAELRAAVKEYRDASSRIGWLADRVASINPGASALVPFERAAVEYRWADMQLTHMYYQADMERDVDSAAIDGASDELRDKATALRKETSGLIGTQPPRSPLRRARPTAPHKPERD